MTDTAAPAPAPATYAARAAALLREHAAYFREIDMRLALQGRTYAACHRERSGIRRRQPAPSRQLALPLRTTMRR